MLLSIANFWRFCHTNGCFRIYFYYLREESMLGMFENYNNPNSMGANDSKDFVTLQQARKDLIGEIDAIIQYDDHLHNTNNQLARETWRNIMSEEMVHVGELLALINYLDPSQLKHVQDGIKEFEERKNR